MITSLLLSLREGLEAALIISIVLGALRRTGRADLNRPLWAGIFSAIVVSLVTAFLLRVMDKELEGIAEQIYEGATLLLAAGVLTWMIFWMRRDSGNMKSRLESKVHRATDSNGGRALYFLAFIAVLREGIELALYITAASLTLSGVQTILGTVLGLSAAFLVGYVLYSTTVRLNLQCFFQVTGLILILFAAGLIAHGIAELNEAGVIPTIINPIWNLNPILSDQSVLGTIFSTLFGYHGSPSLTEALGYSGYVIVTLFVIIKGKKPKPVLVIPPASATYPSPADTGTSPVDLADHPAGRRTRTKIDARHT